jgi:coproporphyrinogen III oxidase
MELKSKYARDFAAIQDSICQKLEALDTSSKFEQDLWSRSGGGGGRTRIFQGDHIEKGGVNFSEVYGKLPKALNSVTMKEAKEFYATGVSIVLHPSNPMVPIIHMNIRYFETDADDWWFGGGIDVTPHYIDREEASMFHRKLKTVCDKTSLDFYPKFKKWADDYFFLKHRDETRGVGGIFFDKLNQVYGLPKEDLFNYVKDVGNAFAPIYSELFSSNYQRDFNDQHKKWQGLRRGRYVEFNLVWDRGTKFGLETNGRTESILMSLPATANWQYNYIPDADSAEAKTLELLKKDIDWLNYKGV